MRHLTYVIAALSIAGAAAAADPAAPPDGVRVSGGGMTTASGLPLYTFAWDTMKGMSHCLGECLLTRRPLTAKPGSKPYGDWSIIGREDDSLQWAYKDRPLYTFTKDQPGQPAQGVVDGTWTLAR